MILTLCSFNSSLHCNEYSYMSSLPRSSSCKNRHRLHFTFCNHGCRVWWTTSKTSESSKATWTKSHIFSWNKQKPLIAVLHIEVITRPDVMSKISYFIARTCTFNVKHHATHGTILINVGPIFSSSQKLSGVIKTGRTVNDYICLCHPCSTRQVPLAEQKKVPLQKI